MDAFRTMLADCHLLDMGYTRNWFSWERGNFLETNIQECLDRGVANEDWMSIFPEAIIQHIPYSFSDHCPLLITTKRKDNERPERSFKFEAWWVLEDSFVEEVRCIWDNSSGDLLQKLERVRKGLDRWASRIRRSRKVKKEVLTSRLIELMESERDDKNLAELSDMKIQLNFEIGKDERYWKQRARVNWLQFGNRNTAFFINK
ncbi:uncharacterized protein LOC105761896 [Gossypium raimondii]|uniref:uncharacterized protein LOC105761896 n=1 Tax=Gossypium raimondii TaxID=29730 RepID=UPI00063AB49E|nr:uncharacterized protein LOC105761896 [Gossypium raimondii]